MVTCTNEGCQVTVSAKDLVHHMEHDCKFRTVHCAMCGNPIIFSHQRVWLCCKTFIWDFIAILRFVSGSLQP